MWPVRPHGPQPMKERVIIHISSANQLVSVFVYPAKDAVFFSALSVALLNWSLLPEEAAGRIMVSEFSNDATIAFSCRITFPLQSRCPTVSILVPWLVVTGYFVCKNSIPDDGVRVELVENVRVGVKPPG